MSSLRELMRRIARLERDVRRLSTQPQLGHSSVDDGAISVYANDSLTMLVGTQYDGTSAPAVVGGPVPPTPLLPGVTESPGGLTVVWSGLFENDAVAPMDFARVEIHVSLDPYFQPDALTMRGVFSSPIGGEFFVSLSDVTEHYVGLITRAESGKPSLMSARVAGRPLPSGGAPGEVSHIVTSPGTQTITLPTAPIRGRLTWVGLSQDESMWSIAGNVVTVPDPSGHLRTGDTLTFSYDA